VTYFKELSWHSADEVEKKQETLVKRELNIFFDLKFPIYLQSVRIKLANGEKS
jgi:hypothetical protein